MTVACRNEFENNCSRLRAVLIRFWKRSREIILINWHLGFTAFGGPAVHFQLVKRPHLLKMFPSADYINEFW